MNHERVISDIHTIIYNKVNTDQLSFKPTKRVKKMISNFVVKLHKKYGIIGVQFLADYFCFQWEYWVNLKKKKKIDISWIIGDKAIVRWVKRKPSYEYYYRKNLLERYSIMYSNLIELDIRFDEGLSEYEEREKKFFTGVRRLVHCMENTTLFNPSSKICLSCSERKNCKIILMNSEELRSSAVSRGLFTVKSK